jgi:hypothetical protein
MEQCALSERALINGFVKLSVQGKERLFSYNTASNENVAEENSTSFYKPFYGSMYLPQSL